MSSLRKVIRDILPKSVRKGVRQKRAWLDRFLRELGAKKRSQAIQKLPYLSEENFETIIKEHLHVKPGDSVLVQSSLDMLKLSFNPSVALHILREAVGPEGRLMFLAFPMVSASSFVASGQRFDVKRTPTTAGLFSEVARRHPEAVRSLHPTKSVCVIGKDAAWMVADHEKTLYPFGPESPYGKLIEEGGKAIGLGLTSYHMSMLHCAPDHMKEAYPVDIYDKEIQYVECIDYDGQVKQVGVFLQSLKVPFPMVNWFLKKQIPKGVYSDVFVNGRPFYVCDVGKLNEKSLELAEMGITMYPKSCYKIKS